MDISTRRPALAAPLLLLGYGLFRYLDGLDGHHGPSFAWNAGHALMLAAFACFAALIIQMRRSIRGPSVRRAAVTTTLAVVGMAGVLAFVRVTLDDLFPRAGNVLALPGVLHDTGPLLFLLGLVGLMVDVAIHEPHRMPVWAPVTVVLGFATIAADLDLLPAAAALFLLGFLPFIRASSLPRLLQ